jgi:hypothetical protein
MDSNKNSLVAEKNLIPVATATASNKMVSKLKLGARKLKLGARKLMLRARK